MFDFQKFVRDRRLQPLLDFVAVKYQLAGGSRELSDEELEVFAAGNPVSGNNGKGSAAHVAREDKSDDH
jgi:hypothetical protein